MYLYMLELVSSFWIRWKTLQLVPNNSICTNNEQLSEGLFYCLWVVVFFIILACTLYVNCITWIFIHLFISWHKCSLHEWKRALRLRVQVRHFTVVFCFVVLITLKLSTATWNEFFGSVPSFIKHIWFSFKVKDCVVVIVCGHFFLLWPL